MKTVISKARNIAYQLGVLFANTLTTKDVSNVYKKGTWY